MPGWKYALQQWILLFRELLAVFGKELCGAAARINRYAVDSAGIIIAFFLPLYKIAPAKAPD
ncbi:MAG: hypothetical protein KH704_09400 [Clostridiales bacterium]|nr:hypothetical protein [Clostridiales bacterium]